MSGPTSAATPSVRSEVGRLRSVLLHRPGDELRRVTPGTMDELLFDELLWVEEAQREHDAFADVLRGAGVEVRYVEQLLADVVADRAAAEELVARHVTDTTCGPGAVDRVRCRTWCSPATAPRGSARAWCCHR
ncbi:MAG: arginine deiminase family protein [Nitriliruptor sp.]